MDSGQLRFGKYELRELLGRSDTTKVWKAFDSQLNRYVALKILDANLQNDPEFVIRFQQQARGIASLHHPNIVPIYDVSVSPSPESNSYTASIVMNYVEGTSLANYIHNTSRKGKFPPVGDIIHLFGSISAAIDYAHQHGIIHGGLRPSNILLDSNNTVHSPIGEPILTNFGMNKLQGISTVLLDGSSIDSLVYVSPEQVQGQPPSKASDIYALGVLLFEVCTGALPFQGNSPSAVMQQYINGTPASPSLINPHVPPALEKVILRSLAKDPASRFPNASSMAAALAQAFNMPISTSSAPQRKPPHTPAPATGPTENPTYIMSSRSNLLIDGTASSPSLQIVKESTPPPATFVSGPHSLVPQSTITPPLSFQAVNSAQSILSSSPTPIDKQQAVPIAPEPPPKRRRGRIIAVLALCAVLLLGSVLGTLLLLSHNGATPNSVVGSAFFISSEQSNGSNNPGINDEMLVKLNKISDPATGKSYYAWLLSDKGKSPVTSIFLGPVKVNHGSGTVTYSDPQHTNLLASNSRVLITEESANTLPTSPSQDQHTWRYYAELSQITDSRDTVYHLSMLSHLRYLLVSDPTLDKLGLFGGLDSHLYSNVASILTWAGSARDYWGDKGALLFMQQHITRILDYLDGNAYVQIDVPQLNGITPIIDTPVGLLGPNPATPTSAYISEISGHLKAITQASSTAADQRTLATQLIGAIDNVQQHLQSIRQDAKELITMNQQQLLSQNALHTLDDMEDQALYAYVGQLDPSTNNTVKEGVIQIHESIQHLAAFNITPFS